MIVYRNSLQLGRVFLRRRSARRAAVAVEFAVVMPVMVMMLLGAVELGRSVMANHSVGEFGINAALCGVYDCAVVLITGDDATVKEGKELLGDGLHGVAVKRGLTRYSARNIPPKQARQMIEDGAKRALTSPIKVKPYVPAKPTTITVDLGTADSASNFKGRHGVEFVNPLQIKSRGKDWMEAWNQIWHY